MTAVKIYVIFLLTYLGMAAGRLPWLRVDRTGLALLGLIALLGTGTLTMDEIGARIDMPTLMLLFALMIISAQFVTAGFCDTVFAQLGRASGSPHRVLALTILFSGGLSAFLANDILVFVATPLLIEAIMARGLNPRPYVLALIASSNIGSAATIIGAPQTIVIGELGDLRLPTYLLACGIPAMVGLLIVFIVLAILWRGQLTETEPALITLVSPPAPVEHRPHDRNQTNKGFLAMAGLLAAFCTALPRDGIALSIAAFLLLNHKFTSRTMIAAVDWPVLLLVACLFGVAGALGNTALPGILIEHLQNLHLLPDGLVLLAPLTLLMSCTIGNLPGTILLLQLWQDPPPGTLYGLALLSSLAGNLLVVGSLSNRIIIERAAERNVVIGAGDFARMGVPITLLSMGFGILWLYATGFMPMLPSVD